MNQLQPGEFVIYAGGYTRRTQCGLRVFACRPDSGRLRLLQEVEAPNASFLDVRGNRLYAVSELEENGQVHGAVASFAIDPQTGQLIPLNRVRATGGRPTYVHIDHTGRCLLSANYGAGNVAAYPIEADGRLGEQADLHEHHGSGPNPARQEKPHPHCILTDPQNGYAYVPDLGIDKVVIYRLDPTQPKLTLAGSAATPPASGPRHLAFHPDRPWVYVVGELDATVSFYTHQPDDGTLHLVQTVAGVPTEHSANNTAAEIRISPNGRYLYISNRGHDSIAGFAIDPGTGRLASIGYTPSGGRTPRNFALTPDGRFLLAAHQDSDNLVVFAVDPVTGGLTSTGHEIDAPEAVCVKPVVLLS